MPNALLRTAARAFRTPTRTRCDLPRGATGRRPATGRFVVHAHQGSHVRWDVGIEMGGMLATWTVLKGPSLDPSIKRLTIATDDRPIDGIDRSPALPQGMRGSDAILIWDAGTYALADDEDPLVARQAGRLRLTLSGTHLRGGFSLVRMHGSHSRNWLLTKIWDAQAVVDWAVPQASLAPSVGRRLGAA